MEIYIYISMCAGACIYTSHIYKIHYYFVIATWPREKKQVGLQSFLGRTCSKVHWGGVGSEIAGLPITTKFNLLLVFCHIVSHSESNICHNSKLGNNRKQKHLFV